VFAGGDYPVEYIDEKAALSLVRTTPDDNMRGRDTITFDRGAIREALYDTATHYRAAEAPLNFPFTENNLDILNALKKAAKIDLGKSDIQNYLTERITRANELSSLKKYVRLASQDLREKSNLSDFVVNRFKALIEQLAQKQNEEIIEKRIKGVFYYAPK
jgi:ATP phosphoribosyltransferase regulatory subunit HisZ